MTISVQNTTIFCLGNVLYYADVFGEANVLIRGPGARLRVGSQAFQGETSGYTSGGGTPAASNVIDKFPFATNANATNVGSLTQGRYAVAGQSSTASGYTSGGYGGGVSNTIDKFPFASDASATDVGDLTVARYFPAGQQY